jgi:hypothetical protein
MTSQQSPLGTPYWRLRTAGKAPALIEVVTATVEIRSRRAGEFKGRALDIVGNRVREIPLAVRSGAVILKMEPEYGAVYYELSVD